MGRRQPRARGVVAAVLLPAAVALLVSCGSSDPSAQQTTTSAAATTTASSATTASSTTTASATTTSAGTTPTTAAPTGDPLSAADAEAVREAAAAYWEAYNAYEADRAVSYLDESYRAEKEILVRDEIGRIKMFGVKLGVSEQSPPTLTGPDEAEMYLDMKEPTGMRTILMRFARHGDTWSITYSEEVE